MSGLDISRRRGISVPDGVLLHGIDTSGHTVALGTDLSGTLQVSTTTGGTFNANVSGAIVISKVSGETVVAKISGESINASVSGATVIAKVSGETVSVASGLFVTAQFSATLTLESGSVIVGDTFSVSSGQVSISSGIVSISGNHVVIKISGQSVFLGSPSAAGDYARLIDVGVSPTTGEMEQPHLATYGPIAGVNIQEEGVDYYAIAVNRSGSNALQVASSGLEYILSRISGDTVKIKTSGEPFLIHAMGSGLVNPTNLTYTAYGTDLNALDVYVRNPSAIPVTASGDTILTSISGNLVSLASGVEVVVGSVTADISGNVVIAKISGETTVAASGIEIIWRTPIISGSVQVSGGVIVSGTVNTSVSGNITSLASGSEIIWRIPITSGSVIVSGNVGVLSGAEIVWRVPITSGSVIISGNVGITTSGLEIIWRTPVVSGSIIISGFVGIHSGNVRILSGQLIAKISGEVITMASGMIVASGLNVVIPTVSVSGNVITSKVSGETVSVASGLYVIAEFSATLTLESGSVVIGDSFRVTSGEIHVLSGQLIAKISGETIIAKNSGQIVIAKISGESVTIISATVSVNSGAFYVTVSGNIVTTRPGLGTTTSGSLTSGIRGIATQLPSVAGFSFAITNPSTNNNMWLGGSGIASGMGYLLEPGQSISPPVDNLNRLYACAFTSGQRLSWLSIAY